ncbi:protein 5NUC isoform X2 [Helicoverpa armigera]|uniref:protein 5NUC isoform X2 n=1 Tax=Helicoverpa armigera TaxID=29058 RepID=UPI003082E597
MKLLVATLLAVVALASGNVLKPKGSFELLILHNNDMHAHFEQSSQRSGTCTNDDREAGKCYGGFPRVAHVVKEARAAALNHTGPPVLYLNAGDTYTGTAWFTIYKWKIAAEFVNALQPDAVSLGNHEFDEAVDGVVPFIRNLSAPVVAANLILDKVPQLKDLKNLYKSVVIVKDHVKIGIIGYLTPQTKELAPKNDVEYEDEIPAIRREVKKLKQQNVNILIALGHSGFITDLDIAREVEDIDLVIGGHSNTFLWNAASTSETPEVPEGPYPTEVKQADGRIVRVVQAYAYTKYLGKLHLLFDSAGEIIKCEGTPLLLNQEVPRDPELLTTVNKYRKDMDRINNEPVGTSLVSLNGTGCRLRECNLGDLIADAMLNYTREEHHKEYPDVNIAIVQGGRIRTSIFHEGTPFTVTRGDWISVLPFSDTLVIVTMNGITLKQSLEHSVSTWRTIDSTGQFQQFSGMEVAYDLEKPVGSRVVKARAVCSKCGFYKLQDVKDDYEYQMMMPTFLADGGDGYSMFTNLPRETLLYNELDSVLYYMKKYSPVDTHLDGRIKILNEDKVKVSDVKIERRRMPSNAVAVNYSLNMYYVLTMLFLLKYSLESM